MDALPSNHSFGQIHAAEIALERSTARYHSPQTLSIAVLLSAMLVLGCYSFIGVTPPAHSPSTEFKVRVLPPSPRAMLVPENTPITMPLPEGFTANKAAPPKAAKAKLSAPTTPPATPPQAQPTPEYPPHNARVFNPQLRAQLDAARAGQQHLQQNPLSGNAPILTYQTATGETIAELNGRCYRVVDDDFSPTGKRWSLPTRCHGYKTESDRIAEGLRRAMQRRFQGR